MNKLPLFGIVVGAMCFVCMLIATSAGAMTFLLAEWLVNGIAVTEGTEFHVEAVDTILLEDTDQVSLVK